MIPPGEWQVHIVEEWHRSSVSIWIYQRLGPEEGTNILGPDLATVRQHPLGAPLSEPTMELPDVVSKPLAAALADVLPPDRAQGRHLDDAIKVRDRLLSLVESAAPSSPERGEGK